MGFSLFIRSRIYSLAFDSWNARRAIGTAAGYWNRAADSTWNGPPLTRGVRGVFLFCRVVRLLQRAEEGCEGLKHGYYNLPCVHFLIFLCHDIKNKIDRLVFILKNKGLLECAKRLWNGRKALAALVLFVGRRYYLRPIILWNARSATGTASGP